MAAPRPSKTHIGNHALKPETMMLGYGYDPALSEGAVKPPVFLTSTFVFRSAEEGRDFFDYVSGRKQPPQGSAAGLVYSRFNHPNSEIVEDRLAIYEGAESAWCSHRAWRRSPRRSWPSSAPATSSCIPSRSTAERKLCCRAPWQISASAPSASSTASSEPAIRAAAQEARGKGRVSIILIETPANPTNTLVDISAAAADRRRDRDGPGLRPILVCDNTLLGPVFQHPLAHGADISVYSLTKYVGGHSDLIAGAALGAKATIGPIKALRGSVGTQLDPHSCWMLGRSLETLGAPDGAGQHQRPARRRVSPRSSQGRQGPPSGVPGGRLAGAGGLCPAMHRRRLDLLLRHQGGEKEAFAFLNALEIFKLAVSLGGTESLASHPAAMTHSGVPAAVRDRIGVLDTTIRLSVGIEHPDDLIADLTHALAATVR